MTYTPDLDYEGTDSFEYTVKDDSGTESAPALVSLDVSDLGFPWHNFVLRYDVNDDGFVTAIDPLLIINYINATGAGPLPLPPPIGNPPPFLDVQPDNNVAPSDVAAVINFINAQVPGGEGEGEFADAAAFRQPLLVDPSVVLVNPTSGESIVDEMEPTRRVTPTPALPPSPPTTSRQRISANDWLGTLAADQDNQPRTGSVYDVALEELLDEDESESEF